MKTLVVAAVISAALAMLMTQPVLAQPARLGLLPPVQQAGQQNPPQLQTRDNSATLPLYPATVQPPATLVLPAGTIVTIEATEYLSSKKQHAGDSFIAELQHPLIVDGWVVARAGQTVIGSVAKAKRAGRVKGTSKLALELEQVVLVDGRQVPVKSDMVENNGRTSHGRDLAAVAITTGVGAAIGAVCGAKGAAIGAAAGATAAIAGLLLTRGEETEVGPEKLLTFRLASPVTVTTDQSRQAFRQVTADDYVLPEKVVAVAQNVPGPVVVSQPYPRRVPVSVWPETQVLAAERPGRRECGN